MRGMWPSTTRITVRSALRPFNFMRSVSTLKENPSIYVFSGNETATSSHSAHSHPHTLTLLPSEPPNPSLAVGYTSTLPPTPQSFRANQRFIDILQSTLAQHAHEDPDVQSQAYVMASVSGSNMGAGGVFLTSRGQQSGRASRRRKDAAGGGDSAGAAGQGGFVHVSDSRRAPEYGRTAWPEDIFGSIEVDGGGNIEGNGNYQANHTYRIVTKDGVLGLSPFLRDKLINRLRMEDGKN